MITVSCSGCGAKIFRYQKIGKGRLLYCWKKRIGADFSVHEGTEVHCPGCGCLIGWEEKKRIRMNQGRFESTGSKLKT